MGSYLNNLFPSKGLKKAVLHTILSNEQVIYQRSTKKVQFIISDLWNTRNIHWNSWKWKQSNKTSIISVSLKESESVSFLNINFPKRYQVYYNHWNNYNFSYIKNDFTH